MKNIGAFFDIDGTIYRDSLMVEHFKKLIKYEIVDQKAWVAHARDTFLDWDKRNGNYDDYLLEICDLYVKSLLNVDKRCIDFTSDQVIALKAERVYKYTRSKITWHLENGHKVIFISGSPKFLVEKMAKKYNATDFIGSDYIFEDGKFNGNIYSPVVISGYVPDLLKSISMVSDEVIITGSGMCGKGHKEWVYVADGGPYLKARVKLG